MLDALTRPVAAVAAAVAGAAAPAVAFVARALGYAGVTWLAALALGLAVFLLLEGALGAGAAALQRAADRRTRWMRTIRSQTTLGRVLGPSPGQHLSGRSVAVAGVALAAAVVTVRESPLFSLFILGLGLVLTRYDALRSRRVARASTVADIQEFLRVFLPRYQHYQTVHPAMKESLASAGPTIRPVLLSITQAIEAGASQDEVYRAHLRVAGDSYLARLLGPLSRDRPSRAGAVAEALGDLGVDLIRHRDLLARGRVTFAATRWTLRFLQALGLAAALVVFFQPWYRAYYMATLQRQAMLTALLLVLIGASIFFDLYQASVEERVL